MCLATHTCKQWRTQNIFLGEGEDLKFILNLKGIKFYGIFQTFGASGGRLKFVLNLKGIQGFVAFFKHSGHLGGV